MSRPVLTLQKFDEMMGALNSEGSSLAIESLWGAAAIAKFMGVSDDWVRKIARSPDCPIRMIEGRHFCTRTEIVVWLQMSRKPRDGTI